MKEEQFKLSKLFSPIFFKAICDYKFDRIKGRPSLSKS